MAAVGPTAFGESVHHAFSKKWPQLAPPRLVEVCIMHFSKNRCPQLVGQRFSKKILAGLWKTGIDWVELWKTGIDWGELWKTGSSSGTELWKMKTEFGK